MPEHHLKPGAQLDEERDAWPPVLAAGPDPLPRYAELYCQSNFSFQHGAGPPPAQGGPAKQPGKRAFGQNPPR